MNDWSRCVRCTCGRMFWTAVPSKTRCAECIAFYFWLRLALPSTCELKVLEDEPDEKSTDG